MTMASFSQVSGFHSPSTTTPPPPAPSIQTYQRVDRGAAWDRTLVRASLLAIVVSADITVVAWVFPLAQMVAEWLGVSFLGAIRIGVFATVGCLPAVLAASSVAWRRLVRGF